MSKIKILVNGQEKELDSNSTIQDILETLEIKGPMLVIEKNLDIVPKDQYSSLLNDGDKLEIVGFFGGG